MRLAVQPRPARSAVRTDHGRAGGATVADVFGLVDGVDVGQPRGRYRLRAVIAATQPVVGGLPDSRLAARHTQQTLLTGPRRTRLAARGPAGHRNRRLALEPFMQ